MRVYPSPKPNGSCPKKPVRHDAPVVQNGKIKNPPITQTTFKTVQNKETGKKN